MHYFGAERGNRWLLRLATRVRPLEKIILNWVSQVNNRIWLGLVRAIRLKAPVKKVNSIILFTVFK